MRLCVSLSRRRRGPAGLRSSATVEHRNGRTTAVPLCGVHRQNCIIASTTITITHGIRKIYQGTDRILSTSLAPYNFA